MRQTTHIAKAIANEMRYLRNIFIIVCKITKKRVTLQGTINFIYKA